VLMGDFARRSSDWASDQGQRMGTHSEGAADARKVNNRNTKTPSLRISDSLAGMAPGRSVQRGRQKQSQFGMKRSRASKHHLSTSRAQNKTVTVDAMRFLTGGWGTLAATFQIFETSKAVDVITFGAGPGRESERDRGASASGSRPPGSGHSQIERVEADKGSEKPGTARRNRR